MPDAELSTYEAFAPAESESEHPTPGEDPSHTPLESPSESGIPRAGDHCTGQLRALTDRVGEFHERAAGQEAIIQRMQQRIEELQSEVARSIYAPVINELASLHAEATEAADRDPSGFTPEQVRREFTAFLTRVETCLEHLGVEPLAATPLDEFDSRTQTAVGTTTTTDATLDRRVSSVVRQGFAPPGARRATVFTRVLVFAYDATSAEDCAMAAPHVHPAATQNPAVAATSEARSPR